MASETLPMDIMSDGCYQVLKRKLIPIHYANLAEIALNDLGLSKKDGDWQRQIEDVREKMLLKGRLDTFYTGKPCYLGAIRWWFDDNQLRLAHPTDGIWIAGSASLGMDGAFEALMRDPYMKIKKPVPRERVARARANGLVVEKHVANWFKQNWPEFYLPPDNEYFWETPCDHDFKLRIDQSVFKVDVSNKSLSGKYGNPGQGKRKVDFHLICEVIDKDVLLKAVFTGKNYDTQIYPDVNGVCPERMIVWLNCIQGGLDYSAICQHIMGIARITNA